MISLKRNMQADRYEGIIRHLGKDINLFVVIDHNMNNDIIAVRARAEVEVVEELTMVVP